MTLPVASTRRRSEALIKLNATPNGFTQKVVGSTGSYAMSDGCFASVQFENNLEHLLAA